MNTMDLFQKEAPEVAKAFNGLIESIVESKGIGAKTKQLIYIALKAAQGDDTAIKFHVPMAKQIGAIKGVARCRPGAMSIFDTAVQE